MVPGYFFSGFELHLGIIFACGPALRQFFAYRKRNRSVLPASNMQYPNEDFEKMRYRINLRDILWYRSAPIVGGKVLEASKIFRSDDPEPPPGNSSDTPAGSPRKIKRSVLDIWEERVKNVFTTNTSATTDEGQKV